MTRKILIAFSAAAMVALSAAGTASAQVRNVTSTVKPTLTGGVYDANNYLKVFGGQTAAVSASTGAKVGNLTFLQPTQRSMYDVLGWVSYSYKWYRVANGTYTVISGYGPLGVNQNAGRNATTADVGYHLSLMMRPCYGDPDDETLNVCSSQASPGDANLSNSAQSAKVAFFASTAPTVSSIVANKISVASHGTWQGSVTGSTKAFQWQSCTGDGTGCSNIAGATARKRTLTSAQNGTYIRVKMTLTTTQGEGVSADAYSNAVGYNLVG